MRQRSGIVLGLGSVVFLLWAAFWGVVIWVACHFLAKFW